MPIRRAHLINPSYRTYILTLKTHHFLVDNGMIRVYLPVITTCYGPQLDKGLTISISWAERKWWGYWGLRRLKLMTSERSRISRLRPLVKSSWFFTAWWLVAFHSLQEPQLIFQDLWCFINYSVIQSPYFWIIDIRQVKSILWIVCHIAWNTEAP